MQHYHGISAHGPMKRQGGRAILAKTSLVWSPDLEALV